MGKDHQTFISFKLTRYVGQLFLVVTNTWEKWLRGGKMYLGSWFRSFSPWSAAPLPWAWGETAHHVEGYSGGKKVINSWQRKQRREREGERSGTGYSLPRADPQWPASCQYAPPAYSFHLLLIINGWIYWWNESPIIQLLPKGVATSECCCTGN